MGRSLNPEAVRTYRDDWNERVEDRRKSVTHGEPAPANTAPGRFATPVRPTDTVDALGVIEVRRMGYRAEDAVPDWDRVATEIGDLARYARDFRDATRVEVLRVAFELASATRQSMLPDVAWILHRAVTEAMPYVPRRKPTTWELEGPEHLRVAFAAEIGRMLVYDGARYLKDMRIVKAGSAILGFALSTTKRAQPPEVRKEVEAAFQERIDAAHEHKERDIARWLEFERAEALKRGSGDLASVEDLFESSS